MCLSDLEKNLVHDIGPQLSAGQTYSPIGSEWPRLKMAEVHLWCASLCDFENDIGHLERIMSREERDRAARFRFLRDRQNFVLRRGILRLLLSKYIDQSPQDIVLRCGEWGKPELDAAEACEKIAFNASHSEGLALYAISSCGPVGVDVEQKRDMPDLKEIVNHFFSEREARSLMNQPEESYLDAFFAGWTRKESVLKAMGEGLGEKLANVEVALLPDEQPSILPLKSTMEHLLLDWHLTSFSPVPGYVACLATRNRPDDVQLRPIPGKILE